jgi:hypothetical protein
MCAVPVCTVPVCTVLVCTVPVCLAVYPAALSVVSVQFGHLAATKALLEKDAAINNTNNNNKKEFT